MARQKWDNQITADVQWVLANFLASREGEEFIDKYFAGLIPEDRELWKAVIKWKEMKEK